MPLVGEVPPPPNAVTSPRKRAASTSTSTRSAKLADQQPSKAAARTETLMGLAGIGQGIFIMGGNYADAETVDMYARPFLTAVAGLGDVHPNFGESLDKADTFNPYLAVFLAGIPMALQFMANHGRVDASKLSMGGLKDPAILHNRQMAKVASIQADLMEEQRRSQEAALQAQQRAQQAYESLHSSPESAHV